MSSDEYLNYAMSNRQEWEQHGKEAVAQMSANYLPPLLEDDDEEDEVFEDEISSSPNIKSHHHNDDNKETTNKCSAHGVNSCKICTTNDDDDDKDKMTEKVCLKMVEVDDEGMLTTASRPRREHALPA